MNVAHREESYWGKWWIERESLVSCLETERYEEEAQSYETHSSIPHINIVTRREWHAAGHGPRVNIKEDRIQRLLGNTRDGNGGADCYNNRGIQWLSRADTQEYVQQDEDHHLLVWCNHHRYMSNHIRYTWYVEGELERKRNDQLCRW